LDRSTLAHIPLFSKLTPEEWELFETRGQLREYPAGAFLFREGDAAQSFWLILTGAVEVIKSWGSGEERQLLVMQPGDFIGELGVVHQNHRRTASARAMGAVQAFEVPLAMLERLLRSQSNLALPILREAVARFLKTENAAIQDLIEKNIQLAQSLQDLKAAQAQIIQQEKLEHELSMARRIQESFLPHSPLRLPGWDMHISWKPAHQVSGDFYDFIPLPGGRTAVVVGDVAGKGMPAALVMAVSRSIIRASVSRGGEAGELLAQINELLVEEMPPAMFVTAFLALWDPNSGEIAYANAGHCLPVHYDSGECRELRARGMPLGLLPGMVYEANQTVLAPGSWVLFYSDALSEAHTPQGELFGMERLHQSVRQAGGAGSAAEIVAHMSGVHTAFTGGQDEPEDDLTMISLYRQPP
jgi:serine phosphatase RsbU (regulator of sigma subunit)